MVFRHADKSASVDFEVSPDSNVTDEQIDEVISKYFDKKCDFCPIELKALADAKVHYLKDHKVRNGYLKCCSTKHRTAHQIADHVNWHIDPSLFT